MDINPIGNNLKQVKSIWRVSEEERKSLEPRRQVMEPTPQLEREIVRLKRMNPSMSVEEIERYLRYNENVEVPQNVIRLILRRNDLPENSINYGILGEVPCIQGAIFDRIAWT